MTAIRARLTDTDLRRAAADLAVSELRDPRHPGVVVRYHKCRRRASYHYVLHHGGRRLTRKLASWPQVPCAVFVERLPQLVASLISHPQAPTRCAELLSWADLLGWYAGRLRADRTMEDKSRTNALSLISTQLAPLFGPLPLSLSRRQIDDLVLRWLADYALETVRGGYGLLRRCIRQAMTLSLIESDPLMGLRFADLCQRRHRIQPGRLRPSHAPMLRDQLAACGDDVGAMLCRMMIMHGTRIGETRQAQWREFDLAGDSPAWHIPPEHTKSRRGHVLPLTPAAVALLTAYHSSAPRRSVYLFPGASGQPLSARNASRHVAAVSAGDWAAHDLRKLARTRWADQGADYLVGELLVNHALSKLDRTYIGSMLASQQRAALEAYHDWLAQLNII